MRTEERNKKDRDMQLLLLSKEDTIAELQKECDIAKKSCEDIIRTSQRNTSEREEHWKSEHDRLERLVDSANTRLQKLEVEKSR
jgi:hypothetical protein